MHRLPTQGTQRQLLKLRKSSGLVFVESLRQHVEVTFVHRMDIRQGVDAHRSLWSRVVEAFQLFADQHTA
ncbi:hypothetical protein D3C80_1982960 [compost metagenome]